MRAGDAPSLADLAAMVARLRDPDRGCDWAKVQTFETIAPYTIEEAYEVADRIAADDMDGLKDELGDLALQVVFHSAIAEQAGHFGLSDVIAAICAKMVRRRPHILGDAAASPGWESIKAAERAAKDRDDASTLAGVARALPALVRAEKLQKRAATVGFDWPDPSGPRDKVIEEIDEVDTATPDGRAEEIGDLLFAVVNWARHLNIDAEAALRSANAKFERRFRAMESLDQEFAARSLDEKEALWLRAKRSEGRSATP